MRGLGRSGVGVTKTTSYRRGQEILTHRSGIRRIIHNLLLLGWFLLLAIFCATDVGAIITNAGNVWKSGPGMKHAGRMRGKPPGKDKRHSHGTMDEERVLRKIKCLTQRCRIETPKYK